MSIPVPKHYMKYILLFSGTILFLVFLAAEIPHGEEGTCRALLEEDNICLSPLVYGGGFVVSLGLMLIGTVMIVRQVRGDEAG